MFAAHRKLIFASVLFLTLLAFVKITKVNASTIIDPYGRIVVESKGEVLGEEDENNRESGSSGSESSGSPGSDSSGSGSSRSSGSSGSSGSSDAKTETTTSGGTTIRTEERKDGEVRTEVRFPSGTKVKTRQEEGRTRTDIYEGGMKLRLERRDDRTVVKLRAENGEEVELPAGNEEEIIKIQERADKGSIKVRTMGEKFVVARENISATTKFPLSVNLETNELTVSTPAGDRVVTILPDQAVKNMFAANVIDQIGGFAFTQDAEKIATQEGATLEQVIELSTTREGILAYEIPGVKQEKLLGFLNVNIQKTAVVSAETGELIRVQQNIVSQILDLISF